LSRVASAPPPILASSASSLVNMGCMSSAPKHSIVDTSNWVHLVIDPSTGSVLLAGEGGNKLSGEMMSQGTVGPSPDGKTWTATPQNPNHWVQAKASVTWDEKKLGGQVKYTVLTKAEFQQLFDTSGSKCLDVDTPEEIEKRITSEQVKKPAKASGNMCVCGKAEWGENLYLVTGEVNDRVNVINHKTGVVCLSMSQWNMGSMVKYYTSNVNREDRASTRKDKQASRADEAYCGTRIACPQDQTQAHGGPICIDVKPELVAKLPLALFCASYMFSSFDFNGVEC